LPPEFSVTNNHHFNKERRHKWTLFLLLAGNLAFKLLIFYNTNSFAVSEARSNYNFLQAIEKGAHPALFEGGYRSTLAYIGYFFKSLTGTLDAFFWFQALVSTLSLYILYCICLRLTTERSSALFAVLLATLSLDYHLLTPVFYYQIFEVFFVLLVVYLILLMIDGKRNISLAGVILVPTLIYLSLLFRGTLAFLSWLLIAMALYFVWRRKYGAFARLAAAGVLTMVLFIALPQGNFKNRNITSANDFKFYGHTLYGGDGGEGTFIYKENETRYKEKLARFMQARHYDKLTVKVRNEFQSREIKEFITKTPHKWLLLQARKIAYTFGIVPIRDSLELLTSGKFPLNWRLSALIIQVPYVFMLLLFVVLLVLFFNGADLTNEKTLFMFLLLLYLVASTCLYGHYQERYRQVVVIAGMMPLAAYYFSKFTGRSAQKPVRRGRYILLGLILIIIFAHWGYQAYDVLVIHKDRYAEAIRQF
jgi:hypothetical protein